VTRKKLLAIVYSLKHFRQYLLGRQFKIRTDHAPLTWLRKMPEPIGQQARWLEIMEEFEFEVTHRPGVKHTNADALSRRPCNLKSCACKQVNSSVVVTNNMVNSAMICSVKTNQNDDEYWTFEGIKQAQELDENISRIVQFIIRSPDKPPWEKVAMLNHETKCLWSMWPRLRLWQGLLQRKFEVIETRKIIWQVVLPKVMRDKFLSEAHGGMTGGHLAKSRTVATVQARAYWPSWSSDFDMFLKKCPACARYHRGNVPRQTSMQTPMVGDPWFRLSLDITGPHPRSRKGNQYILTLVDHFTKWAEAIPVRNHTAQTVAQRLMENVFSRFGAPQQILTDRGSEFESDLFRNLLEWMGIDKLRTTVFKASSNGQVERFHRTLNSMLAKVVSDSQRNWDECVPYVLVAYRATQHESTGFSPNKY